MDRWIYVSPPDGNGRKTILTKLFSNCPADLEVFSHIDSIVERTSNFTGADLKNLVVQAKLNAARRVCTNASAIIQVIPPLPDHSISVS
jgi:cell division protease FtsH